MRLFKFVLCLSILFFAFVFTAQAEEAAELEKMVVTATMTEREIENAPGSIEVITSQEIEEMDVQTVADALQTATGLMVEAETGRTKSPSLRGAGGKHTLILVDGRRLVGGYKNFVDINQISVDMIDRLEVVRGPTSALYGSDAIGGVVNIITKKPPKELAVGATLQYGVNTYGEGEEPAGSAYVGNSFNRFGFLLTCGSRHKHSWDSDGVVPDDGDDVELESINGRFSFDLNENHGLLAGFEYSDRDREGVRFYQNLDRERTAEDKRHNYFLQYDGRPNSLSNIMLRAYHSEHENDIEFSPHADVSAEENAERKLDQVEGRFTGAFWDKHILTVGAEYRKESREDTSGRDDDLDDFGMYLQDEYQVIDPLLIVLGLRFDDNSEFGSEWTPRVSLIYAIFENLRLKTSYGKGFSAPSISELFVTSNRKRGKLVYEPNLDLDPETSESYEAAIEGEHKRFWGRITAFRNEVQDLIEPVHYKSTGKGKKKIDYYRYQNIDEAIMEGVELEFGMDLPWSLSFSGNMTCLNTKDKETDKDLEGQPDYKGYLKLGYNHPGYGLQANIRMNYIGERYYADGTEDDYTLLHCHLSKELFQYVKLFAGVNNIFNIREEKDGIVYVEPTFYYGGLSISY